jgi:4'-phosphopantetheinyl transferase EntD
VIRELLPEGVAAVEVRGDDLEAGLLPEEEAVLERVSPKRRLEFTTGRSCARRALAELNFPPGPILPGPDREPSWPPGAVGSITHCRDYCAAAVAPTSRFASIGIDAEVHDELPEGVLERISLAEERAWLESRAGDGTHWDTVLFSAKESVFKAWFPVARRWLGFEDARVDLVPEEGAFRAHLLVPGPTVGGRPLTGFDGRYVVRDGLVVTAIALPSDSVRGTG